MNSDFQFCCARHLGKSVVVALHEPAGGPMAAPWRELTARTSPQHSSELDLTEPGPAHDSDSHGRGEAVGAVRHLGWDKTVCPPLPPTGADG